MICARYARLSTKGRRQDDKAASIERQLQDAERFTVAHALGAVTGSTVYAEPAGTAGAAYGKRKDGVSHRPAWDRTATTVRLSRDVKLKAALHAVEHGQTLCALIEQAIRAALAKTGPVRRLQLRESRAFYRRHGEVISTEPMKGGQS